MTSPLSSAALRKHDLPSTLDELVRSYAGGLARRETGEGLAGAERDVLRASGLLGLTLPVSAGGLGGATRELFRAARTIARVAPGTAQVFAQHHLMLATFSLLGSPSQFDRAAIETVHERALWGNALDPKDTTVKLVADGERFVLEGEKTVCSGARHADRLLVSALDRTGRLAFVAIATAEAGVHVREDTEGFARLELCRVPVVPHALLETPCTPGSACAALRSYYAQALFAHVHLGIAEGALDRAVALAQRDAVRATDRSASRDVLRRMRAGELTVELEGASALASRAASELDASLVHRDALTLEQRALVARRVGVAKVASARALLAVRTRVSDLLGAHETSRPLERFLAPARSIDDSVDVKLVELGAHTLFGDALA